MALAVLFIVKNKRARAFAWDLAKFAKAIPGILDKTFFHAVPHDRHCHDHHCRGTQGEDCGDTYKTVSSTLHKTEKACMVTRVTCFKEPLMIIAQDLRERPPKPTGGALPDHNFLVVEIQPPSSATPRFCRIELLKAGDRKGKTDASLHHSLCSAVRKRIQDDSYLTKSWEIEFDSCQCNARAGCKHTLAYILACPPDFEGQYKAIGNNCKAFARAVLRALAAPDMAACLSAQQRAACKAAIKDADALDKFSQAIHLFALRFI